MRELIDPTEAQKKAFEDCMAIIEALPEDERYEVQIAIFKGKFRLSIYDDNDD